MKFIIAVISSIVILSAAPIVRGSDQPEAAAISAAEAWLALVDAGNYAESWNAAASPFRQQVSQTIWQQKAASARDHLGAVISRKVQSATYMESMPGAPDGHYVIIRFASSFQKKAAAIETVTPMMDTDGSWRVSGYFIR